MPKRTRTTSTKKKTTKKKKNFQPGVTSIQRVRTSIVTGVSAVPDRLFIKLRYAETFDRTPAGNNDDYVFRGNSIFDPNLTGSGHQPLAHDQWANLYNSYRVRACGIKVQFINTGGPAGIFAIIPSFDVTSFTSINDMAEAPRSKVSMWSSTSSRYGVTLSHYMTTAEVRGVDPQRVELDDLFAAAMNADPTQVWYWHVCGQANNTPFTYSMLVRLTYYVELFGRVALTGS